MGRVRGMKRLCFALLLVSLSCALSAQDQQSPPVVQRYQLHFSGENRSEKYLIDTQTGRIWRLYVIDGLEIAMPVFHGITKEGLGLLPEEEDHARAFRMPMPNPQQSKASSAPPIAPAKPAKP